MQTQEQKRTHRWSAIVQPSHTLDILPGVCEREGCDRSGVRPPPGHTFHMLRCECGRAFYVDHGKQRERRT